jgi:cytochrome c-type biogenesis protein CcmH/NrfG
MTEIEPSPVPEGMWTKTQAYALAIVCLLMGAALGFMLRGSANPAGGNGAAPPAAGEPAAMGGGAAPPQVAQEQLKRTADKEAEPLLAKLKDNPQDVSLLTSIGNVYYDSSQFKEAIGYYEQALKIKPNDPDLRTDLGTAYFSIGNADRALAELDQALKVDAKHANALFNVGVVKWQGKMDVDGAVAAWNKLLEMHPDFPQRERVATLVKQAQQHRTMKPGTMTDKPAQIK